MNITEISVNEAISSANSYEHVLAYEFSRIVWGNPSEVSVNWDECTEAYLFNEKEQIHVWNDGMEHKAAKLAGEDATDHYIDKKLLLADRFGKDKMLIVREYLEPDEDGQVFVAYTRLLSVI